MKVLNSTIKKDAYVITKYDGHFPVFSKIHDILVLCDTVVLHCVTEYFDDHYHAYAVLLSQKHSYVCFDDILDYTILHSHKRNNTVHIFKEIFHCTITQFCVRNYLFNTNNYKFCYTIHLHMHVICQGDILCVPA